MFRENSSHIQENLFGTTSHLSKQQQKRLEKSREYFIYDNFFSQIDESIFSPLYFENNGRPNAAVNSLVTAAMMQSHNGWSVEYLIDQINFNILTRTAVGLKSIDGTPFCEATYYNFQNRLQSHFEKTGENLIDIQFEKLTKKQIETLELKTDIQRTDSFQLLTNIKNRSRVELLVEVLIRLFRSLEVPLQEQFCEHLKPYLNENSEHFVYHLEKGELPHELLTLGEVYHTLYTALKPLVSETNEFKTFARVYSEQFKIAEKKVVVKLPKDVGSNSLQSPDDLDATFRTKRDQFYKGYVATLTETASPDNAINLVTEINVAPNNVDDSTILEDHIEKMKAFTPDLEELHVDGGYGSEGVDTKSVENNITIIQTAVKGRKGAVEFDIEVDETSGITTVSCPLQTVDATKARKRMKAQFSLKTCERCPLKDQCPAQEQNKYRVYRFDSTQILSNKRKRNIQKIPLERRTIRANVEATVKEFSKGFNQCGKIKVRGKFRATLYAIASALSINIGRIHRMSIAK
jgi:hypothetical protein